MFRATSTPSPLAAVARCLSLFRHTINAAPVCLSARRGRRLATRGSSSATPNPKPSSRPRRKALPAAAPPGLQGQAHTNHPPSNSSLPPWSPEHEAVLWSEDGRAFVSGVAGCGKTELLVRLALRHALQGRRVIVATLVSSVRDEIAARVNAFLPRPLCVVGSGHKTREFTPEAFEKARSSPRYESERAKLRAVGLPLSSGEPVAGVGGSGVFAPIPGGKLQLSTVDGVIHQTLMQIDAPWIAENPDRHDLKVSRLLEHVTRARERGRGEGGGESGGRGLSASGPVSLFRGPTMKDRSPAQVLLVDEFQDFDEERAQLLSQMAALPLLPPPRDARMSGEGEGDGGLLCAIAVGDVMQSVFDHAIRSGLHAHPFNSWAAVASQPQPAATRRYQIGTCYRCPPSHLRLANLLTKSGARVLRGGSGVDGQHMSSPLPTPMLTKIAAAREELPGSTPLLFTHEATTSNAGAADAALRVVALIGAFFDSDPTLVPGDVVVVMAKVNNNAVMGVLENELEEEYKRRGFKPAGKKKSSKKPEHEHEAHEHEPEHEPAEDDEAPARVARDFVHYFATETDASRVTIQWSRAAGKTALCSIHALKGRSARLVVLVGVTEGAIPREVRVHRHLELVDVSLLNVGLTRSTQYLAVGMSSTRPSRYLAERREEMLGGGLAVPVWDEGEVVVVGARGGGGDRHDSSSSLSSSASSAESPASFERRVSRRYAELLMSRRIARSSPPLWGVAEKSYLTRASGRPEQLVFPVFRLADRNQREADGNAVFDPALWERVPLPGSVPVSFPSTVDAGDDLISTTLGVMGELALRLRIEEGGQRRGECTSMRRLASVMEVLRNAAAQGKRPGGATAAHAVVDVAVVFTRDERALSQWVDAGVNELILSGHFEASPGSWDAYVQEICAPEAEPEMGRAVREIRRSWKEGEQGAGEGRRSPFARPVLLIDASLKAALAGSSPPSLSTSSLLSSAPSLWSASVVFLLVTQQIRRGRLADLLASCPKKEEEWWPRLLANVDAFASWLQRERNAAGAASDSPFHFSRALELSLRESDPKVLQEMTLEGQPSAKIGVRGVCDIYDPLTSTLIEVKVGVSSSSSPRPRGERREEEGGVVAAAGRNPAPRWVAQITIYAALEGLRGMREPFHPRRMCLVDLADFLAGVLEIEGYRREHIDKLLRGT